MKKRILVQLFCTFFIAANTNLNSQDLEFEWVRQAGGMNFDNGRSVTIDPRGNLYVTGYFERQATFGNTTLNSYGDRDIFIAKYDNNGNLKWVQQAGGRYDDGGYGIASDNSGNIVVTGYFKRTSQFGDTILTSAGSADIFIAKYTSEDGKLIWVQQAGGNRDFGIGAGVQETGNAIASDIFGNVLVTGYFRGTATFGDTTITSYGDTTLFGFGSVDIFIAKFTSNGSLIWAQHAGGDEFDEGYGIATDSSGNILVTGKFDENASFGDTTLFNDSNDDMFVAKYSVNGKLRWIKHASGTFFYVVGLKITTDISNNILFTGYFRYDAIFDTTKIKSDGNNDDIFLAKYDANGKFLWVKPAGGKGLDFGLSIVADNSGNNFVTGVFEGTAIFSDTTLTSTGSSDIFIAKYDKNGDLVWVKQAGGVNSDAGTSITADGLDNIFVTGYFSGVANFGALSLVSVGSSDIFILKMSKTLTGIKQEGTIINSFHLFQNYPNPFNPITEIEYRIPETKKYLIKTNLEIYDILGHKVKTLVDGFQKSGYYRVKWDGRDEKGNELTGGVFLYRLRAERFVQTKKMILIK